MPRKQKQRQKQSQKQVVNINLAGKSSGKAKRKYTRRTQTRVVQQQPIYNFTPQPYQLTPQVFMTPQPRQELEIPSLSQQQPKKNTVGEIKMNIPEPPVPKLNQYTEPNLSEYTKPAPKPPTNIINQPPTLSGLQEAITAQRERMRKVQTSSKKPQENVLIAEMVQARENLAPVAIAERKPFISPVAIASPIKRGRPSKGKQLPQYKERELMTMEDR